MGVLHKVTHSPGDGHADYVFFCPGCKCGHGVWTTHPNGVTGATWSFNGDLNKPTFSPSLLIKGTRFSDVGQADYDAWAVAGYPDRQGKPFDSVPHVCHSVVSDGMIHFLGDCTHELAGKTVPLPEF